MRLGRFIFFGKDECHFLYMNKMKSYQKIKQEPLGDLSVINIFKNHIYNH